MQCNNVPRSGTHCYIVHNQREMQILIKSEIRDHMKIITLRTNDVINIVRRHYLHKYNTRTKIVTISPGLPYVNDAYGPAATPKSMLRACIGLTVALNLSTMSPHVTERIAVSRRCGWWR
jgi:hypothetical protein